MAYRLEGKDIVISGFEKGIAESPHLGIGDMRNIDIISVPGEASVNFSEVAATVPPAFNAIAFTAQDSGNTITISSTTGLYVGCAIVLNTNTAGGLSTGVVYYVFNITATTFQVRLAAMIGSAINISSDGSGTLTTYQYGNQRNLSGSGSPMSYYVDRNATNGIMNSIYLVDHSNYVWLLMPASNSSSIPANALVFMGNIGGAGASSSAITGITIWNGYLILFYTSDTDYVDPSDPLTGSGPAANWVYSWETVTVANASGRISVFVSQEDGNIYWTSSTGLGSIIKTPGDTFDPTDSDTYTINLDAISLPENDRATCIGELGPLLYIGGQQSFVYVWDKLSPGFNNILTVPEVYVRNIIGVGQNAYVFAGNRGRIYITNGSSIDRWKKIPDYVTGTVTPYFTWRDASCARNQLYFSFTCVDNSDTDLTTVSGAWAIDLETEALRLLNKQTASGYSGTTYMVTEMPYQNLGTLQAGSGIAMGWFVSPNYGVDVGSSNPYSNYESYIDTDIIPVGTFIDPWSPTQIEWKTSAPLVSGEGIKISYRTNITSSFTQIGESTTAGAISDLYKANFQKAQWVQFRIELKSTNTTPSYARLTEIRIRDYTAP
jgi:hypothetical protein